MPTIKLETHINAPIQLCFDLSTSIDLHKISTAATNEKAIAGTTEGLINLNECVTWEATHFGIRQQLTTKITGFDSPNVARSVPKKLVVGRNLPDYVLAGSQSPTGECKLAENHFPKSHLTHHIYHRHPQHLTPEKSFMTALPHWREFVGRHCAQANSCLRS